LLKEFLMGSKGKSLVIVESPAKAKTINRFLGPSFVVKASMGHVRDLPKSKLGVDLENDFKPHYVMIRGKAKAVKALKEASAVARDIYLAPDMDREGEAIAWHLARIIGKDQHRVRRVIFNEITDTAIKEAFENPTDIDMRKVDAQQARRVLDRLVGYLVSPLLMQVVAKGTSAGRVQSVALRLICEREEEISAFVTREYWTIDGEFKTPQGDLLTARLDKIDGTKGEIDTLERAQSLEVDVKTPAYAVTGVDKKPKRRNPRPPYITSTLQQDAARRLGFSPRKTMMVAQELYEGIDLGGRDRGGLITYMRTDSIRVAAAACDAARKYIGSTFGKEYIPSRAAKFRKPKSSQDAHEAIRPTDVFRIPGDITGYLTRDQARLYKLIWERFLASQMAQALFEVTQVEIRGGPYDFKATGTVTKFDGFLKVYSDKSGEKETVLPYVDRGDPLELVTVDVQRHETQPPPRYTDASLIKELEDKGIGRPSTYATIMDTIIARKYVERTKKALNPTELGQAVLAILLKTFPDIFEVGFTARMEGDLDRIESGEDDWVEVVRHFYEPFERDLRQAKARKKELKRELEEEVDEKCELCGSPMVKKFGKYGKFLACSAFPKCKNTKPLEEESAGDARCPECGGDMIVRTGKYGKFLACKRYPECKGTRPYTLGIKCPEEGCGGEIKEKRTKKGRVFYGCENYPRCKFASWDKPVARSCAACGYSIMVEKTGGKKGTRLVCPRCKSEADP
jgi:DNA topoisomerase-1